MKGKKQQSRRQLIKKGIAAGAGILGLSRVELAAAMGERKKPKASNIGDKIIVEKSEKIFTTVGKEQQYNAFTNIELWHGKYYVVFRQGAKHGGDDFTGRIALLESTHLDNWTDSVAMDQASKDDRDPKLFSTPERLFLYATTPGGGGPGPGGFVA